MIITDPVTQARVDRFASRLRTLRGRESQASLGKRAGVTQVTISNYERRQRVPDILTAQKLSDALNTPISILLDDRALFGAPDETD